MAKQKSEFFVKLPGERTLLHVTKHNITKLTLLKGDPSGLIGNYEFKCYGDCTNIYGRIYDLRGDISKLSGDVSNVYGYATGCELDCTGLIGDVQILYLQKVAEEAFKKNGIYLNKHRFLTNEENEELWQVWQKIANSTIGLKKEEYKLIKNPVKNKPPFEVDKWGRHYIADSDGNIICFSINPADILLLRTNQESQTCWSIYDKNNGGLRMRLLLARACINPTVGVCFKIKYIDKFNIFPGLSFKYYKHSLGTFFQYDEGGLLPFGNVGINVGTWFNKYDRYEKTIEPLVVGHDGIHTLGHGDQNKLTFYEKFIKEDFSLWKEHSYVKPEGCEHILSNFLGSIFLDGDFNVITKTYNFTDAFVKRHIKCLKDRIDSGVFYNEEV